MSTALAKLVPQNLAEAQEVAAVLAKSELVPKDFIGKPANILLAIMSGSEIGLSPAQSLQSIAVINGRPSIWGDASIGLVEASGLCEGWSDSFDPATNTASFTITRRGRGPITRTFSEADAKAANLLGKPGPWQQYKKRMLFNRARAWALRDVFPDVLKGLRIVEEEQDVTPINVTPAPAAPRRKSETVAPVEVVAEPVTAQEEAAQGQAFIPGTEPEPQEESQGLPEFPEETPKPQAGPVISEPQRKRFFAIWKASGKTAEQVKAHLVKVIGTEHSAEIPKAKYEDICKWAEDKANNAA